MYKSFFDDNRQSIMRNYFLGELSKLGTTRVYRKNELIDVHLESYAAIVVKGVISQSIISSKGQEKLLYLIRSGEIFGEMCYFCGGTDSIITKARETTEVAIIDQKILEEVLREHPEVYRHFIHSITRKFRIVMLQLTNNVFNDSVGKIADALLRLSSCAEPDANGRTSVNMIFTHQELANNIGCSRITVSRCLSKFMKEKIINYENKKIIINDPGALKEYVDKVVED